MQEIKVELVTEKSRIFNSLAPIVGLMAAPTTYPLLTEHPKNAWNSTPV